MEDVKIRLALLWLIFCCAMIVVPALDLYKPGHIEDIIAGEIGGVPITAEMILVIAIIMLVPPVMATLSITLQGSTNRWANIIVGIVYVVLSLVGPIEYLANPVAHTAYLILVAIVQIVVTVLIVWYAWKWPTQEA